MKILKKLSIFMIKIIKHYQIEINVWIIVYLNLLTALWTLIFFNAKFLIKSYDIFSHVQISIKNTKIYKAIFQSSFELFSIACFPFHHELKKNIGKKKIKVKQAKPIIPFYGFNSQINEFIVVTKQWFRANVNRYFFYLWRW